MPSEPEVPIVSTPAPPEPEANAALATRRPAPVDPRLLEILVCPVTKGELSYDRDAGELISRKAGLAYPVRDGIPIMLPDEARRLQE